MAHPPDPGCRAQRPLGPLGVLGVLSLLGLRLHLRIPVKIQWPGAQVRYLCLDVCFKLCCYEYGEL